LKFPDLSSGHLAYPAVSMAVAAGVISTGADNAFQPTLVVSGAEAVSAVSRVQALTAGLPPPAGQSQR
jgi:hypothetical protein